MVEQPLVRVHHDVLIERSPVRVTSRDSGVVDAVDDLLQHPGKKMFRSRSEHLQTQATVDGEEQGVRVFQAEVAPAQPRKEQVCQERRARRDYRLDTSGADGRRVQLDFSALEQLL